MKISQPSFSHLVITRFNIDYTHHYNIPYECNDEWHQQRFKIFKRYCLPSVADQTCKNFDWIILFNEEEKDRYNSFIDKTKKTLRNIVFLFVRPTQNHRKVLNQFIQDHYSTTYLITTRMDNDDSVARHFIDSIQKRFIEHTLRQEKSIYVINPGNGYQFESRFPYRKTMIKHYSFSPFISIVSKNDHGSHTSVFEYPHLEWDGKSESKDLGDDPFWIQIIHGRNRSNQILSLHLLPRIHDDNFKFMKKAPGNHFFSGVLLLPLQYLMTFMKRLSQKLRKALFQ